MAADDGAKNDCVYNVVIHARAKEAIALPSADGRSRIYAVDLIGDLWADFTHFFVDARASQSAGDLVARNRSLRAALSCLFSHVDGLVTTAADSLSRHDIDVAVNLWLADTKRSKGRLPFWAQADRPSLCQKMFMLRDVAWYRMRERLPFVRTDLKVLRDILNHPGIKKSGPHPVTRETIDYDAVALYFLPLEEVEQAASYLNKWLDAVCEVYDIERFCDTAAMCERLANAYSDEAGISRAGWSSPSAI